MAETALTKQIVSHKDDTPLTFVAFDGTNGMSFENPTGKGRILIKNDDATDKTLTVISQEEVDGNLAVEDPTYTIIAGEIVELADFPKRTYNDANNNVILTIDDDTNVSIAFTN